MQKLFLFFLLSFIHSAFTFSQVEVSSRLQQAVAEANPDDYIRTLVLLRDQLDVVSMDKLFYEESYSPEERVYRLITALKNKSGETQSNLINYLEEKLQNGDVFTYESFWISNLIMVDAKPVILNELFLHNDIAEMDIDAVIELEKPVESSIEEVEGIESVEPGLKIINAHLLWALGITGQGRLVMGMDTGVFPNHPALNHKWRGNTVPSNQAWFDPAFGTTVPNDCDGHGSHTMGTMVGRSLTTADTIGVAIDAEWIASNSLCGGSPHTSRSIASFQWAMDPDGNPSTINDMPDVISNSWYDPSTAYDECTGIYKTTLDAVEAAGIAVVFSAGNNGPGTSTITKPKNINTNTVNVFCVGAISGSSYLGGNTSPIASFSSRGPSNCGGTGPLLIKPEVSAPGVSVRSSGTSTGYNLLSGTSMAAPHVAGSVALLKQAFPNLTGRQILEALYNTATDLGTAGEDNTYGTGLIDVYAAYLSLSGLELTSFTALIEGLYNGVEMTPDTVTVELRSIASPFSLVDQTKIFLNENGQGASRFYNAENGTPYYLVLKHRNAVETWSASGLTFTNNTLSYDFTSASSQAFQNNLTLKNGKWCIYSGDVNQDGFVNTQDLNLVYNDNINGIEGYINTDLNGDQLTEIEDMSLVFINNVLGIERKRP